MNTLITRKEYMNNEYTHEQFYGQFVTRSLAEYVKNSVGADRIAKSTYQHFNDIPLNLWDRLNAKHFIDTKKWALAGMGIDAVGGYVEAVTGKFGWSMSDNTCITKAAAKLIRRELAEPIQGRYIKVEYRPLDMASGLLSYETKINGTVDGILDYFYHDRGLFNVDGVPSKIIGIKFL